MNTTQTHYTQQDFARALKRGAYAWPGGYPTFFVCSDGGCLCFDCAKKEAKRIVEAIRDQSHDGWRIEAQDVNWESELFCDHCGKQIESAYGNSNALN